MNRGRATAMILLAIISCATALFPSRDALAQGGPGTIDTVAGGATGDGLLATQAVLGHSDGDSWGLGVATDADGNVYVSDTLQNRVRVVNMHGTPITVLGVAVEPGHVETVAGTGVGTWGIDGEGGDPADDLGDGGPAVSATLYVPGGLAVDGTGNLFIAERGNGRVRKVDTSGTITTVAGGGWSWPGDGGPATDAQLCSPTDVDVDGAGNLYISEQCQPRIRLVNMQGTPITKFGVTVEPGYIETVAGTGEPGYNGEAGVATTMQLDAPADVAVDSAGESLYIADRENDRIRRVDHLGNLNKVAGGNCPAPPCVPVGIALRGTTELFFTERFDCRGLRMWDSNGDTVVTAADAPPTTVMGAGCGFSGDGGPAISAYLSDELGIGIDPAGIVYIRDAGSRHVRGVIPSPEPPSGDGNIDGDVDEIIDTVLGGGGPLGEGGPATSASLWYPARLDRDAAGNLYIADTRNHRIRKVTAGADGMVTGGADAPNEIITTVVGGGSGCPGQENPEGDGCAPTEATLNNPSGVTLDSASNIYIADTGHNRIRVVNTQASAITVANVTIPAGKIDTVAGTGVWDFGGDDGPATSATMRNPQDVVLDSSGNIYIADMGNHRVRRVDDASGVITTVAGSGAACTDPQDGGPATNASLCQPTAVLLDAAGNLLIADNGNLRVRRVSTGSDGVVDGDPDEIIITVAGGGEPCAERLNDVGDGCPAREATLGEHAVRDIAVDSDGNLYISHPDPDVVRRVVPGADGVIDGGTDEVIYTVVYDLRYYHGFRGDGGMACAAASRWPNGLLIQPDPLNASVEHLYIVDDWADHIRRAEAPLDPDPDGDGLFTCLGYPSERDLGTDPFNPDNDGDGCLDGEEAENAPAPKPGATGAYDPLAWYDFFDVPVPAVADPGPNGSRSQAVTMADVLAVLFYVGAFDGDEGSPNISGVSYDSVKGSCDWDADTVPDKEGMCYDRSPSADPSPPWEAGPPSGAVNMADVLAVLVQVGLSCAGPP
jgi:sugar lactone lactonase YvrE